MESIDKIRKIELYNNPENVMEEYIKIRPELLEDNLLRALFKSKAFKSLANKTQVTQRFVTQKAVATRLIHTLEVNATAEYIADKLGVDTKSVRRIAFFHDVGHLPFGHIGEETIKALINNIYETGVIFEKLIPKEEQSKFDKYGDFIYRRINSTKFEVFLEENYKNLTTEECEILARALNLDPDVARGFYGFTINDFNFKHPDDKVLKYIFTNLKRRNNIYTDLIPEKEIEKLEKYIDFKHEQMSSIIFKKIVSENKISLSEEDFNMIYDGILKHGNGSFNANSASGKIVGISDKIAYITRDLEDAEKLGFKLNYPKALGNTPEEIRNTVLNDLINNSTREKISLSVDVTKYFDELKKYMYHNFYKSKDLEILDNMLATWLAGDFLDRYIEIKDIKQDYEDFNRFSDYPEYIENKELPIEYIFDIDNSLLEFVTLSDGDILKNSQISEDAIRNIAISYRKAEILTEIAL